MSGTVLGTFTGKCCDADVVNNNGMYLSRELFDTLINSDDYRTAIKNKYYIGFLGHPDDPNCMDFKDACVVMTDMEMQDNGDIVGSFDLIDTPVGRVVKAFVDAGVKFGISIRGAGDVSSDGTVDPDTFVFRGFDLVTFPAYNDCVPEFQEIAASSDVEAQSKYRKVCSAVRSNLSSITSCEALDVVKEQFNPNSDEYQMIEDRMSDIKGDMDEDLRVEVLEQKVKGLVQAYVDSVRHAKELKHKLECLEGERDRQSRKAERIESIVSSQRIKAESTVSSLRDRNNSLKRTVRASSNAAKEASRRAEVAERKLQDIQAENKRLVEANTSLKGKLNSITSANNSTVRKNLLSDKKIQASESLVRSQKESISSLKSELRETVAENQKLRESTSNLEATIDELNSRVEACEQVIFDYQQAYADSCAYAAGVSLDKVPVTSSTTVDELRSYIYSKAASGYKPPKEVVDDVSTDVESGTIVAI